MSEPGTISEAGQEDSGSVVPSPDLAELLRKHAANEPLSFREAGRVGAHYRNLRKAAPAPRGVAPDAGIQTLPADDALDEAPGLPPLDPAVVKETVGVCLDAINGAAISALQWKCKLAGADDESTRLVCGAAELKGHSRSLMVEPSPVLADMAGIDPRIFPIGSFCSGLATWAAGFRTAFKILDQRIQQNAASQHRGTENNQIPKPQ